MSRIPPHVHVRDGEVAPEQRRPDALQKLHYVVLQLAPVELIQKDARLPRHQPLLDDKNFSF